MRAATLARAAADEGGYARPSSGISGCFDEAHRPDAILNDVIRRVRSVAWVLRHPIHAIDSRRIGIDFVGPRFALVVLGILLVPIGYGTRVTLRAMGHADGRSAFETVGLIVAGSALAAAGVYLAAVACVLIAKQLTATPQRGRHDRDQPQT